jgi:hypothetical protein
VTAVPHDLIAPGMGRTIVETVVRVELTLEAAEVTYDTGRRQRVPAGAAVPFDDDRVSADVEGVMAQRARRSSAASAPAPAPVDGPTRAAP